MYRFRTIPAKILISGKISPKFLAEISLKLKGQFLEKISRMYLKLWKKSRECTALGQFRQKSCECTALGQFRQKSCECTALGQFL